MPRPTRAVAAAVLCVEATVLLIVAPAAVWVWGPRRSPSGPPAARPAQHRQDTAPTCLGGAGRCLSSCESHGLSLRPSSPCPAPFACCAQEGSLSAQEKFHGHTEAEPPLATRSSMSDVNEKNSELRIILPKTADPGPEDSIEGTQPAPEQEGSGRPCRMDPQDTWPTIVLWRDTEAGAIEGSPYTFLCMAALLSDRIALTVGTRLREILRRSNLLGDLKVRVFTRPNSATPPLRSACPHGLYSAECATQDTRDEAGDDHCDVIVRQVVLHGQSDAALLLLDCGLPKRSRNDHACPPSKNSEPEYDFSRCLLHGYDRINRWHRNLPRSFTGHNHIIQDLHEQQGVDTACASGFGSLCELHEGSPLMCQMGDSWYLVGIGLEKCFTEDQKYELYLLTTSFSISIWMNETFAAWNQTTRMLEHIGLR